MRDFSKKLTKPNEMDMKKIPKPRMEDYDRRERRERDKLARQQVQHNDRQQGLFREPIRVDPSEGDQIITSKLGDFSMAKTLIEQKGFIGITSGRRPLPMQPPQPQPMPPQSSSSNNRLPLPPPSHSYPQQQSQQAHPPQSRLPYMKQADNKPPYSGRGGYPGQPIKNDIRSSSGMAPPRGPPPQSISSSSNLLPPPATSIMPNGRQGGSSSSKMGHHSSSSLHNGHFSQPSIPNMHKIPQEKDIKLILSEMMTSVTPHTEISATPRIQMDNYDLNGPNRHKYSLAPPMPKPPKESPIKQPKDKLLMQNSTILDHDLELSESDDDRKKQTSVDHTSANSSESSESNSSESGSEESNGTKVEPAPPPAPPSNQYDWSLGRFFNKQAATQAQNDASPHSGLGVSVMSGGMPTAHQIPEPSIKNEPSMSVEEDHLGSASISPLREPPILTHMTQQPLSPIMNHLPAIEEIKKESDSLFPMPGKMHPSTTAAIDEFVTIQPGQIKNESFEKSPSSSPIHDEKQVYAVESDQSSAIFEAAAEYEGIKPLSGLSDSSSCETVPEADKGMVPPVLAPPSPLPPVIPTPAIVPVVPKPSPKLKSSTPPTAGRKRRKRLPKDKKQSGMDCSSDEEDGEYSNTVSPAKSAGECIEKKGRGRPRKNTPSGNISSASSTKGPTLTAKKEVGQGASKKTTARRRMSRQNSVQKLNIKSRETIDTSDPSSSEDEDKIGSNMAGVGVIGSSKVNRGRVLPTKAAKKANVMPVVSAVASRPIPIPPPTMKHDVVMPVPPVSNRRIVKQINKRAAVENSSSDEDDDDKSDDDDKDSSSSTSSSSDTSIDDRLSPTRVANENTTHSMGASGPGGSSSSHRLQYSPIKKASSKSKVSLSSCSDDHSDSESEKSRRDKKIRDKTKSDKNKSDTLRKLFNLRDGGAKNKGQVLIVDQSEELQNQAKEQQLHHQQQLQHQQPQQTMHATTPNATPTLAVAVQPITPTTTTHHHEKLLSPKAFKSNISNSTENLIQQQSILNYNNNGSNNNSSNNSTNSHILNNTSSLLNSSNHSNNSNIMATDQPRLKSPRIMTPTQAMTPTGVAGILAKTPDRSSVERKLSTRIATPTRTPTRTPNRTPTRTPTPTTQLANIPSPHLSPAGAAYGPPVIPHHILICKIDLSRLPRYNPEWKKNPYRLYGLSPPISSPVAGDAILAADLAASSRQKATPRSGSSTPTLLGSSTSTVTGVLPGSKVSSNGGTFENENLNLTKSIDGSVDRSMGGGTPPKPADYSEKHLHHQNNGYVVGRVPPTTTITTTGDIKHENIKYEQDDYVAKYNLKLAGVKQEQLIKNEFKPGNGSVVNTGNGADDALIAASTNMTMDEKQRPISPSSLSNSSSKDEYISGASKPRRKRSSSSSSSPFKDKKRKKDKEMMQKDMLEQLPPTNHDRLTDKPPAASVVPPYGLPSMQQQLLLQPSVTSPKTTTTVAPPPVLFPPHQNNTNIPPLQPPQQPTTGGTVRVYRSYFERSDDVMGEGHCDATLLEEAVRRKHAADRETNSFDQVTLYLEAALYFLLSGAEMEQDKRTEKAAWTMYKDTLALIKFISTKIRSQQTAPNGQADNHNKVAILSLRCQSLISLKLYKMKRIDCVEVLKISNDFFAKGSTEIVNGNTPSSISPTNSVCSQGSGSNTPPAQMVPLNVHIALQKQTQFFNYFISCHDLWDQADILVKKGNHTDFFIALDHDYGPLTLHSTIYDVFKYVQAGLKKLKEMKV